MVFTLPFHTTGLAKDNLHKHVNTCNQGEVFVFFYPYYQPQFVFGETIPNLTFCLARKNLKDEGISDIALFYFTGSIVR